jgi:hypothetical protein
MTRNRRIHRIAGAILVALIVLGLSTSTGRDRKIYEVDAQVYSVPTTQSDAARAISAYERLMERHMDLTERNLTNLAADLKVLGEMFDHIDDRLTQMDWRLARIERHLGVPLIPPPAPARVDPNAPSSPDPQGAAAPSSPPQQGMAK